MHHKRGQAYIYCKLNVALYGTLKATIIFWKILSKSLKERGFTINPYEWCVANDIINRSQCTIVWHVDNLKLSYKDPEVIDKLIASLDEEYGKIGKMTVRRGKIHEYLGMTLDFSRPGKFFMDMEQYIDEVMKDLPKEFCGMAETPTAEKMFKTRSDAGYMDQETAELFHNVNAHCYS